MASSEYFPQISRVACNLLTTTDPLDLALRQIRPNLNKASMAKRELRGQLDAWDLIVQAPSRVTNGWRCGALYIYNAVQQTLF